MPDWTPKIVQAWLVEPKGGGFKRDAGTSCYYPIAINLPWPPGVTPGCAGFLDLSANSRPTILICAAMRPA